MALAPGERHSKCALESQTVEGEPSCEEGCCRWVSPCWLPLRGSGRFSPNRRRTGEPEPGPAGGPAERARPPHREGQGPGGQRLARPRFAGRRPEMGQGPRPFVDAHMPYAPDLKAAFLFGEGVHNWWNRRNNRYMDDLFVYDVQGHRWICAYPGTDVVNVQLELDKNGFEVGKDGRPVPVSQLVHGYEMVSYDTDLKRFLFMPGCSGRLAGRRPLREEAHGLGRPRPGDAQEQQPVVVRCPHRPLGFAQGERARPGKRAGERVGLRAQHQETVLLARESAE